MSTSETRRVRLELLEQEQSLRNRDQTNAPESFVGTITGSPGTTVPAYFKVQPVAVNGTPTEGGSATLNNLIGTPLVYVLGPSVPTAGQTITCWRAGGGWVGETCCGSSKCGFSCSACGGVTTLNGGTISDSIGSYQIQWNPGGAFFFNPTDGIFMPPNGTIFATFGGSCLDDSGASLGYFYHVYCDGDGNLVCEIWTPPIHQCAFDPTICGYDAGEIGGTPADPVAMFTSTVSPDSCDGQITATFAFSDNSSCAGLTIPPPVTSASVSIPIDPGTPEYCCQSCPIPKTGVKATVFVTPNLFGPYPLIDRGGGVLSTDCIYDAAWTGACGNVLRVKCVGGETVFEFVSFDGGTGCPGPSCNGDEFILSTQNGEVQFASYSCAPYHLHLNQEGAPNPVSDAFFHIDIFT